MKLSFSTLGCPDWSLEQIADQAKALGYDGVELRTHSDGNHLSPDATPEELARVAKLFRDRGVPVMSIKGYSRFAFTDPAEVQRNQALLRKLVGVAVALGARFVRTFAGEVPKGSDSATMTKVVTDAIRPLAVEAAAKGVRIAMELHDDWCSGAQVAALARDIACPAGFGIVYDILNAFEANREPWPATYAAVKDHVCYCHMKDGWTGPDGKLRIVMLGAGELPLRDILQRFRRDGFDGFFSNEWEKKWHPEIEGPERAFPQYVHKMRSVWAEVAPAAAAKR